MTAFKSICSKCFILGLGRFELPTSWSRSHYTAAFFRFKKIIWRRLSHIAYTIEMMHTLSFENIVDVFDNPPCVYNHFALIVLFASS